MNLEEKTVKSNVVFQGHIIQVHSDAALRADGKPCTREYVEHPGGACVLFVREGKVLLVRQYRYAYQEETLEIPAGKLNPGEAPDVTAARELPRAILLQGRDFIEIAVICSRSRN